MAQALTVMLTCGGSLIILFIFTVYKLLQLPVIVNMIYIKYGTQSVTEVIAELSKLKTDVPSEITNNLVAISTTLQQSLEAGKDEEE